MHSLLSKAVFVLHVVAQTKSDGSSCIKNEKSQFEADTEFKFSPITLDKLQKILDD